MEYPYVRKPFERVRSPKSFEGAVSKTDTSFGNDTDVNNIVARFQRTGQMPPTNGNPQFCDVTGLQDDLTAIIQRGKDAQEELHKIKREQIAKESELNEQNAQTAKEYEAFKAAQAAEQNQEGEPAPS